MWTKNGSIPKPETDGTEGWIEVADKPECPEGKEVVWLNWAWVVRDPKPDDRDGYRWKWNHDAMQWIEYALPETVETVAVAPVKALTSAELSALYSCDFSALTSTELASMTTSDLAAFASAQISAL